MGAAVMSNRTTVISQPLRFRKRRGDMVCTYKTFEEYVNPYSALIKTAEQNGFYENERDAINAAVNAGYDPRDIVVVFFLY